MGRNIRRSSLGLGAVAAVVALGLWAGRTNAQLTTGGTGTSIDDLISQITGTTGTSTTGTTGTTGTTTTTDTGSTPAPTDGTSPITTGLNNVTLGSISGRTPGAMVQRGIGLHTGSVELPGDADMFEEPNLISQTLFTGTEAILQAVQTNLQQLVQRLFFGLGLGGGLFGPGNPVIGNPIQNAATLGSGMVTPLP